MAKLRYCTSLNILFVCVNAVTMIVQHIISLILYCRKYSPRMKINTIDYIFLVVNLQKCRWRNIPSLGRPSFYLDLEAFTFILDVLFIFPYNFILSKRGKVVIKEECCVNFEEKKQ